VTRPALAGAAAEVLRRTLERPPSLGTGRLLCIDGPSGAGKTTLADAVRRAFRPGRARVLHMDAVYDGWDGLEAGMTTVAEDVVGPLRHGQPGRFRRFDWHAGTFAEEHHLPPGPLLVVEGVGAGNPAYADATTLLVWVEAPGDVRLERALDRDGRDTRDLLVSWRAREDAMFATTAIRDRADLLVDGVTGDLRPCR
jgi:uridine kinase